FEGLPASDLDAAQKKLLLALVDEYVRNADADAAVRHLDAIQRAGIDQLHFSWRGPTNDVRSPFYYRLHGPRLIIEFAVQEPNHIHTIMRDPQNDYGMDWLGLHYEDMRGADDDDGAELTSSLHRDLDHFARFPPARAHPGGNLAGSSRLDR